MTSTPAYFPQQLRLPSGGGVQGYSSSQQARAGSDFASRSAPMAMPSCDGANHTRPYITGKSQMVAVPPQGTHPANYQTGPPMPGTFSQPQNVQPSFSHPSPTKGAVTWRTTYGSGSAPLASSQSPQGVSFQDDRGQSARPQLQAPTAPSVTVMTSAGRMTVEQLVVSLQTTELQLAKAREKNQELVAELVRKDQEVACLRKELSVTTKAPARTPRGSYSDDVRVAQSGLSQLGKNKSYDWLGEKNHMKPPAKPLRPDQGEVGVMGPGGSQYGSMSYAATLGDCEANPACSGSSSAMSPAKKRAGGKTKRKAKTAASKASMKPEEPGVLAGRVTKKATCKQARENKTRDATPPASTAPVAGSTASSAGPVDLTIDLTSPAPEVDSLGPEVSRGDRDRELALALFECGDMVDKEPETNGPTEADVGRGKDGRSDVEAEWEVDEELTVPAAQAGDEPALFGELEIIMSPKLGPCKLSASSPLRAPPAGGNESESEEE
ncbi:MAG: hypothetical protein M4579_005024 [Chaenotheca gracillima]|nr:MAG: hypothetical protein M4579_005024 [Chaenotheca gracillima]